MSSPGEILHVTNLRDFNYENAVKIGCSVKQDEKKLRSHSNQFVYNPTDHYVKVIDARKAKEQLRALILAEYPNSKIEVGSTHPHKFKISLAEARIFADLVGSEQATNSHLYFSSKEREAASERHDNSEKKQNKYRFEKEDDMDDENCEEYDIEEKYEDEKDLSEEETPVVTILKTRINFDGVKQYLIKASTSLDLTEEDINGYLCQGYRLVRCQRTSYGARNVEWSNSWINSKYIDN